MKSQIPLTGGSSDTEDPDVFESEACWLPVTLLKPAVQVSTTTAGYVTWDHLPEHSEPATQSVCFVRLMDETRTSPSCGQNVQKSP